MHVIEYCIESDCSIRVLILLHDMLLPCSKILQIMLAVVILFGPTYSSRTLINQTLFIRRTDYPELTVLLD